MKIAILGGSFDPPHRGHALVAKRLLKLYGFDQVWLMPLFAHPFNSKNLTPAEKRLEMTKYLEGKKVKVSDCEIKKKTTSYTIDTLKFLNKKCPEDKFSWIIGTDQALDFTKWKNWQEIINKFKLIVVPRTGFRQAEKILKKIAGMVSHPENIILVDRKKFPPVYVSSLLIRQKINPPAGGKKSIAGLVPKKVEEYIIRNKLYLA